MLTRFNRVLRFWHHLSTAHVNQIKDTPVVPLFFTDRKLVIHPVIPTLPVEQKISFKFLQQPPSLVPVAPMTRYPEEEKKALPERKFCTATQKRMNISIKKLNEICAQIRGKHTLDALSILEGLKQKCAPWLSGTIRAAIRNGVAHKGMDAERLYVHQIVLGKNRSIRGKRYHARGRVNVAMKPFSQYTIILEEQSVEGLYKVIVTGHLSPTFASIIRNKLLLDNTDLAVIRKYQNLLTAKGRQQQRLMFKRKVDRLLQENLASGVYVSRDTVERKTLEKESKEFAEKYWANKRRFAEEKIATRQSVYFKNEGL